MNFQEKVQAMKASEIVQAMVDGLKAAHVKVSMSTFGNAHHGICYGCAATNTLCQISGKTFTPDVIDESYNRSMFIESDLEFMLWFEHAIDNLRSGDILCYNRKAEMLEIAVIPTEYPAYLPLLTTATYMNDLHHYETLAQWLRDQGL